MYILIGLFAVVVIACVGLVIWATSSDTRSQKAIGWLHRFSR